MACGPDDPGRLTFTDRRYHRLDVKWKPIKHIPNSDLWLTKYGRRDKADKSSYASLSTAPAGWKGVVHKTSDTTVIHAGRFFREARLMVELTILWPGSRDIGLESHMLESVQVAGDDVQHRLWQAMGLSVSCPAGFDLRESSLKVGQIQWDFFPVTSDGKVAKGSPMLRVERIALPDHWLKGGAVRDWLVERLPAGYRQLRQRTVPWGRHSADELVTTAKAPLGARMRGLHEMRLDLAWRCPVEGRVYHLEFTEQRSDEEISLPEQMAVHCCRPIPDVRTRNVG